MRHFTSVTTVWKDFTDIMMSEKTMQKILYWIISFIQSTGIDKDDSFPGCSVIKNPSANTGDTGDRGSILGLRRSPGGGNGNPLQYSCQDKPMDRGTWKSTVNGVAKSWTCLSN